MVTAKTFCTFCPSISMPRRDSASASTVGAGSTSVSRITGPAGSRISTSGRFPSCRVSATAGRPSFSRSSRANTSLMTLSWLRSLSIGVVMRIMLVPMFAEINAPQHHASTTWVVGLRPSTRQHSNPHTTHLSPPNPANPLIPRILIQTIPSSHNSPLCALRALCGEFPS